MLNRGRRKSPHPDSKKSGTKKTKIKEKIKAKAKCFQTRSIKWSALFPTTLAGLKNSPSGFQGNFEKYGVEINGEKFLIKTTREEDASIIHNEIMANTKWQKPFTLKSSSMAT